MKDTRLEYTIKNAVRIAKKRYLRVAMWAFVANLMGTGSSSAYKVCEEFGSNPDDEPEKSVREQVK